MKIAVMTDSNSGITQDMAKELGVYVIPMPFTIDGENYFEDVNLSQEAFYQLLSQDNEVSTSQPAVGDLLEMWDRLLKDYDEVVYIPMSSGLSGSCDTATTLSMDYEGRVVVVNNRRISLTLYRAVLDALALAEDGLSATQIKERLEETQYDATIYIMVDTMKYLKKGGRVTPAGAAIGAVLNIKPVLEIQGGKLDAFAKPRGQKMAYSVMLDALEKDLNGRLAPIKDRLELYAAYTADEEQVKMMTALMEERFPDYGKVQYMPLPLSVACHIGPGALGIGAVIALDK